MDDVAVLPARHRLDVDAYHRMAEAGSSLRSDRTVKLPLYAKAGIGEFWLIDLQRRILTAYRHPIADGYGESAEHRAGDELALALAPEIVVRLRPMPG